MRLLINFLISGFGFILVAQFNGQINNDNSLLSNANPKYPLLTIPFQKTQFNQ